MKKIVASFLLMVMLLSLLMPIAYAGDPLGVIIDITWDPDAAIPGENVKVHYVVRVIHTEDDTPYTGIHEIKNLTIDINQHVIPWYSHGENAEQPPAEYTADRRALVVEEIIDPLPEGDTYVRFGKYWESFTVTITAEVDIYNGYCILSGTNSAEVPRYHDPVSKPEFIVDAGDIELSETREDCLEGEYDGSVAVSWEARGGKDPYINPYCSVNGDKMYYDNYQGYSAHINKNIGGLAGASGTYSVDAQDYDYLSFYMSAYDSNLDTFSKNVLLTNKNPTDKAFPYDFMITCDKQFYSVGDTVRLNYAFDFPDKQASYSIHEPGQTTYAYPVFIESQGETEIQLSTAGFYHVNFQFYSETETIMITKSVYAYPIAIKLGEFTWEGDTAAVSYELNGDLSQFAKVRASWYGDGNLIHTEDSGNSEGVFSFKPSGSIQQLRVYVSALSTENHSVSPLVSETLSRSSRAKLPDGVLMIGDKAFLNTAIKDFEIPEGVTIGNNVFPEGATVRTVSRAE